MVPRVRFPEWNKTNIKITDWNPSNNQLTIEVEVEANKISLNKVYSQPYLQNNFKNPLPKKEIDFVKQGEKAVFKHVFNIKPNTNEWLEMDIRALPDIIGLKVLIRSEYVNKPTMIEILEAEADQIKSPMFIGTSMPLLVREDIALGVTPEIAFTPTFKHDNTSYYIWVPLDCAENKTTNSAIKLFREAIETKNLKSIEATGQNLLKRFKTDKKTIVFKKSKGDNFAIPTKIALEMLNTDIICIKAILSGNTENLENLYKNMKPSYTKAFIAYNLFSIFKAKKEEEKAKIYKKEALDQQPAWPLLKNEN